MNLIRRWSVNKHFIFVLFSSVVFFALSIFGQAGPGIPMPGGASTPKKTLSQPDRAGLILKKDGVSSGYVLMATRGYTAAQLIDSDGYVVHEWIYDEVAGASAYLLPNGNLLHTVRNSVEEIGDFVQELTWDGEVIWEYSTDQDVQRIHHDIEPLPNGNVLITVWEKKVTEEYVEAGRNPATIPNNVMWIDVIYEIKKTGKTSGEVVWSWSSWDHLVQNRDESRSNYGDPTAPNRIDVNQSRGLKDKLFSDWLHINSVSYEPSRDEIILSVHAFDEIWVISRKTGELLYRWGNPQRYGRGDEEDHILFSQHDVHWVKDGLRGAGNILIFNNKVAGYNVNIYNNYSSVLEVKPPLTASGEWPEPAEDGTLPPCEVVWEYTGVPDAKFYSSNFAGAQRLETGGTLICVGVHGVLFELDANGERVWEYVNPIFSSGPGLKRLENWNTLPPGGGNTLFRAYKYTPDYPAFAGRNLSRKRVLGK